MKNIVALILNVLAFSCLISLNSCKDEIPFVPTVDPPSEIVLGELVSHSVAGVVLDEYNLPVANATVKLREHETTTNDEGQFFLFNVNTNQNHAYIKVEKTGYFLGSRSYVPVKGVNKVEIKLLTKQGVGVFQTSTGGSVSVDGVSITFGTDFEDAQGNVYDGYIRVYASYLDPLSPDLQYEMPGSLRAFGQDGESVLQTFGMVAVELEDFSGNEIHLAEGAKAEIKFPIPSGMSAEAPSSIPLWFFDEELGYWKEEGSATKVNGEYVGEVAHFSFWNCDIPGPSLQCFGRILAKGDLPASGVRVSLSHPRFGTSYAWTNDKGEFGGIIPEGEVLNLCVSYFDMGDSVFIGNAEYCLDVGPFYKGDDFGDIKIPDLELVKVTGSLEDCDGSPTDGFLLLNNRTFAETSNTTFEFYSTLNTSFGVKPISSDGNEIGFLDSFHVKEVDLNVGNLSFCKANQGQWTSSVIGMRVKYKVDGVEYDIVQTSAYEDYYNNVLRLRFGSAANYPSDEFLSIDIPTEYEGNGTYKLSNTNDNDFNIYTGKPSDNTLELYTIFLNVVKIDLGKAGENYLNFSGNVIQYNTATAKNESYSITDGTIYFRMF